MNNLLVFLNQFRVCGTFNVCHFRYFHLDYLYESKQHWNSKGDNDIGDAVHGIMAHHIKFSPHLYCS